MAEQEELPHVVAVMITGKSVERLPWAQLAIKRFHAQDYPPHRRHLLIVQDSDYPALFPERAGQTELHVAPGAVRVTLGELRNRALNYLAEKFPASWVMQWDDDDYPALARMRKHVVATQEWHGELRSLNAMQPQWATTLASQLRYSVPRNVCKRYRGDTWGVFGTVLHCPAADAPRYECVGKHEDSRFLKLFTRHCALPLAAQLYIRVYNALNTWDETHIMGRHDARANVGGNWHSDPTLRQVLCDFCCDLVRSGVLANAELQRLLPK